MKMTKKLKSNVDILGKSVPVLIILFVLAVGTITLALLVNSVAASLLPSYGTVTGTMTVIIQ